MKCMEVTGGSIAADESFRRPGVDVWMHREAVQEPDAGGGDLHLLSSCASGRITRVLLADVCGIGSMFSDISCNLRDLMKQNVNAIRQGRLVRDISDRLEVAAEDGGFASMLISTYFAPTRSLSVCNTGHPCPMVYRAKTGEWEVLKQELIDAPSTATSDHVQPDEYQHFATKLEVGDLFFCFSNILTECLNSNGQSLGSTGIKRLLTKIGVDEPGSLLGQLRNKIENLNPENTQARDATMVLFQATKTGVGWRENLLAPLRLLLGVTDRTRI